MTWLHLGLSALSALMGGFMGGWVVAFRLGRKLAEMESQIRENSNRLERGDKPVGEVPVLRTRVDVIIDELRDFRKQMREDMKQLVSRDECNRRHERDGS